MILFEDWLRHFSSPHPLASGVLRFKEFSLIAERLCSIENPVIIETGCLRNPEGWEGDGNSTAIWNWFGERGAECYSVDINEKHCEIARKLCPKVDVMCWDSIYYLAGNSAVERCNLLYLDSRDYTKGNESFSELHHAGELTVTYERLPSGCLIAIDDCLDNCENHGKDIKGGKHKLCEYFFERAGIKPLFTGFITGWVKP